MKHLIEFFIGTSFLVNSAFAPLITQQPVPDSVCMTDTAEFIVKVLPNTTLQWQFSSNPSDPMSWGDLIVGVSGAQTDTLKVTQPGMYIGDYFRVLVMDTTSTFSETSDSVFLTVFPNPTVELMSVPSGFAFCEGSSIILQTTDMNPLNSHLWAPTGETTSTINVTTGNIIYSVTVTDVNLCSGSSAHLVMENPKPTPQILPIEAEVKFCPGKTLQLMSDSTIYTNYTWSSSPGDTQAFITVSVIGNYMLTVTDGNGCTASTSRVVGVYQPTSQPSISPIIKEFCQGDNLWLVGNSGYSDYVWSTGLHNDSLLISSEGIYTLTVADVNGCTATNTAQTKANALPLSAFSSYPTNLISPPVRVTQVLTFTDQSTSTEGNIVNWNWDFDTGAVPPSAFYSVSQNRPEVFYNEEGLKKVCLEIRNQKGCLDTNCVEFEVIPTDGPFVSLSNPDPPRCLKDTFDVIAIAVNTNPINEDLRQSFVWEYNNTKLDYIPGTVTGDNNSISERARFIFKMQGTELITAHALQIKKNDPNVTKPGLAEITVSSGNQVPSITNPSIPPYLCRGASGSISLSFSPSGDGQLVYSQNGMSATILPITSGFAVIPISASGQLSTITILISSIAIDGCVTETQTQYSIEVRDLPLVQITGPDTVCIEEQSFLHASGANTYQWTINNITPPFDNRDSLLINSNIPGLYDYEVTGSLNGCSDVTSVQVLVAEKPTPEIFGDSVVCKGQVLEYSSHDPLPDHTWILTGGSKISQNRENVLIHWETTGQWLLMLTQNIGKCTRSSTKLITVSDDNSPPYDSLIWLKGGRILLYPNPNKISGLCYQWYKEGVPIQSDTFQGYVVPVGVSDNQLSNYYVKVWYCADGEACAQLISYRSNDSPPEEAEPQLKVVPNPNSGNFDVQYEGLTPGHYIQHIIGTSGRNLYEQELDIASSSGTQPVSAHNLSASVYFVRWVNTTTGSVLITQIVVLP